LGLGNLARAAHWRSLFARARRPPIWPVLDATMVGYSFRLYPPLSAVRARRPTPAGLQRPSPASCESTR